MFILFDPEITRGGFKGYHERGAGKKGKGVVISRLPP
jgi:hypothetical protein